MVLKAYDEPNMTMKAHQTPSIGIATEHIHKNKKVLDGITEDIIKEWDNKVDKVDGKDLSTNDFTNEEKAKLAGLSNYDDTDIKKQIKQNTEACKSLEEAIDGCIYQSLLLDSSGNKIYDSNGREIITEIKGFSSFINILMNIYQNMNHCVMDSNN